MNKMADLFAFIKDEDSMDSRAMWAWIEHRVREGMRDSFGDIPKRIKNIVKISYYINEILFHIAVVPYLILFRGFTLQRALA